MNVCKHFTFDAAHFLPAHPGKCRNLHGHTYHMEVEIGAETLTDGMVMDFGDLKGLVQPLLDRLDHTYLNDLFPTPTAELMVRGIWDELAPQIPEPARLERVRLWETPTSYAEQRRDGSCT